MDHVARHGLSELSLRELAEAVGTSHRMLHYHFGGREGLVAAIVETMESDQRSVLRELARTASTPQAVIRAQWQALTRPEVLPFVALFFEVLALAAHQRPGTEGFLGGLTTPWLDAGRAAATRLGIDADDDELRLGVAVMRGLLIDVLASGEVEPATRALERFLGSGSLPTL